MNKVTILVIMHLVIVENLNNITELVIPMTESRFFKEINLHLDNMIQELFNTLKLDHNYTQTPKIKLLNYIHGSLKNVSETNFRIYHDIKNASASKYDNKTIDALFNVTNIIDEIFSILEFKSNVAIDVVINEFDNTMALFKTYKSIKNDTESDGMIGMVNFFIEKTDRKIGKKKSRKKKKHKKIIKFKGANQRFSRKIFYNLKPWRPYKNSSDLEAYTANRRIYNGDRAKLRRFPFIVSIHVMGEFLCSGSIISRDLIITSASCLQMAYNDPHLLNDPNSITIRTGSELTSKGGIIVPVIEIYYHPMYDPLYLANNLAIVRIKTTEKKNYKVRRIEFDRAKAKLPESGQVSILGWGDKDSYTRYTGPLTMAHLEVYGLEPCKEIYSENYVQDTNFCAGFVTVGGGACNKDIGGPGLLGSLLVGVVSFGPPVCGTRDAPTVFTKLGFYSEWIEYVMKKVLQTPYKNSQAAAFRQTSNYSEIQNQQPIKSKYNPDVLTLKRLFNEYIFSGKMNIKELMPDENKENTMYVKSHYDDGFNNKISATKSVVETTADEFLAHGIDHTIHSVIETQITQSSKNLVSEEVNDENYEYIHDILASFDGDGEPNFNSLTDDYDTMDPYSIGGNEETEEGMSIEMGYTDRNYMSHTLRTNTKYHRTLKQKKYESKASFDKKPKNRLMEGVDPTTAKQTVFEISNSLNINVEKFDVPPALKKMFFRRDNRETTNTYTVTPAMSLRRDDQDLYASNSELDTDSNLYETLKYMM